jgi:hypothetical protein
MEFFSMSDGINTYEVKCKTCRVKFKVQLFDSHDRNLFVADKKDWYCDNCKKAYFSAQTLTLLNEQMTKGFHDLTGTEKMVSWGVKIRGELLNKVDYLKKSLRFRTDDEKQRSDNAFELLFSEWREMTDAKWWIDHRSMTVRDISKRAAELGDSLKTGK